MRKTLLYAFCIAFGSCMSCGDGRSDVVITLAPSEDGSDMTEAIQAAIDSASTFRGRKVEIRLSEGRYDISRQHATECVRHISNTASESENPDMTKHFGMCLHGISNLTISGEGAEIITHGEMTAIAVDSCSDIVFRGFSIDAADPSVPEMTVVGRTDSTLVCRPHASSGYRIDADGVLHWTGEGWEFTGGIAQLFDGKHTLRRDSPMDEYISVSERDSMLVFLYPPGAVPDCGRGDVWQMRHSIRNEVCVFMERCRNVSFEDISFCFLGNFGIVGQYSSDISLKNVRCEPDSLRGRTCAGFADFVQMSGCSGKIVIDSCRFSGAHDDPINIHGTHLKVMEQNAPDRITVRFMHGQTFGFQAFCPGDELEIVDAHTLLPTGSAKVKEVELIDNYHSRLTLDRDVSAAVLAARDAVVENISATPEVEIRNSCFTLTPTRGILVSTRRKAIIENNVFENIPMSAVLVADDGKSWYESGPVRDLTIRGNTFLNCASPVICVSPENDIDAGVVHRGIRIVGNTFVLPSGEGVAVEARSVGGLEIEGNTIVSDMTNAGFFMIESCPDALVKNNTVKTLDVNILNYSR